MYLDGLFTKSIFSSRSSNTFHFTRLWSLFSSSVSLSYQPVFRLCLSRPGFSIWCISMLRVGHSESLDAQRAIPQTSTISQTTRGFNANLLRPNIRTCTQWPFPWWYFMCLDILCLLHTHYSATERRTRSSCSRRSTDTFLPATETWVLCHHHSVKYILSSNSLLPWISVGVHANS